MKSGLLTILLLGAVTSTMVHAQGMINFDIRASGNWPVINPLTGLPLVGPDYVAQLFFAGSLTPAVWQGPSPFRDATGTWAGGMRDFRAGGPGTTVNLVVGVWEGVAYSTIQEASASGDPNTVWGFSYPFTYTIPDPSAPPTAFGMPPITINLIPEPSVIALGILGGLAFLSWRRTSSPRRDLRRSAQWRAL
jgi:hypothetical protein